MIDKRNYRVLFLRHFMRRKLAKKKHMRARVVSRQRAPVQVSGDALVAIPEGKVWLASRKSARTRRASRNDVAHFMKTFGIASPDSGGRSDRRQCWRGGDAIDEGEPRVRGIGDAEVSTRRHRHLHSPGWGADADH